MSKTVVLPGQLGWTCSETEAEFISRKLRASARGLLAEECDWHKAADDSVAPVWRRLGILGSLCELFICVPGCLWYIMLKTDFTQKTPSSIVPPLFIYPDSDSKSGTVFQWEQCIILDCSFDK